MCGIYGAITSEGSSFELDKFLNDQSKLLKHRGPNGFGKHISGPCGLGHTRLSIIDLSGGAQPMLSWDKRYSITFNGEIYNYVELKEELLSLSCRFENNSDTEVILEGYRIWGEDVLSKLNGMFAFAIWDNVEQELFLARDPMGQKPLFYYEGRREFVFSSEMRTFRNVTGSNIDIAGVAHFLSFEGFYGQQTIYQGVKKLPHGHMLKYRNGTLKIKKYFHSAPCSEIVDEREAIIKIDQKMSSAIMRGSRADVPVSMLLSGGLDSSLILAYFRQLHKDNSIEAFHVGSTDKSYDETKYAEMAAKHCNVKLRTYILDFNELSNLARTIPTLLDQPQADPGILPKYFICQEMAKNFKVSLTGDGGDELFYGYLIMKAEKIAQIYKYVPDFIHKYIISLALKSLPTDFGYMSLDFLAKNFIRGFPSDDATRSLKWMNTFNEEAIQSLMPTYSSQFAESITQGTDLVRSYYKSCPDKSAVSRLAYRLQNTYLPDYVLVNSDRASMLNSIELRSPLLDSDLIQTANSLSTNLKMKNFESKYIMKKVAERYLPKELIYRKKVGFTIPIAKVINSTLKEEILYLFSEKYIKDQGIFSYPYISSILNRHYSGKENLYKSIWTLYSLQKWLKGN